MKREAKELNNLIEQVSQKVVDKVVNEKYLVSRMAVIVNEFDPNTNSASIIIPTDLSNHTDYKYPNRTGMTSLRSTVWENGQIKTYGDKVYLVYQSNNISQGWLESNKSLDIVKEVSRDYLTKADAAATYETKTDADSKFVKKTGDTMSGNLIVAAAGANSRFRAQDTTHGGEIRLTWGGNHQTHGLLSTGYSTDGATLTSENKWLIYRNASNTVQLNDGKVGIDGSGNLVATGNFTANGGDITSGYTTRRANSFIGAHSLAGKIYLYAYDKATSNKGLAVMNNAGTYQEILAIDQNNNPTIKGNLTVTGQAYIKNYITINTDVNASLANNNVSSTAYPTSMNIVDNANRIIARSEAVVNPNGSIGMNMYVRNYNTSGGQVAQKGLQFHMNKSGALSWSVSDPDNFVSAIKSSIVDAIYPVGSIYMSVNSTSPATLFGGTWVQLKDRFLLGAGSTYTNGATGGEATHKLTVNEMPSHTHEIQGGGVKLSLVSGNTGYYRLQFATGGGVQQVLNLNTGGDGAHNNMPPYLVVYMWKRTA